MTPAEHPEDDDVASPCSQAPLYCLDMLESEASADFRRHLAGCAACREEVAHSLPAVAALGALAGAQAPPPDLKRRLKRRLKQRLMSRLGPASATPDPPSIVPAGAGPWEPSDPPGASTRTLFTDAATGRSTFLVRMEPGASYPRHSHQGYEECYVLEGSVRVGDTLLRAGDFQRAEDGSVHDVHSTDDGCLLLVMAGGTQTV